MKINCNSSKGPGIKQRKPSGFQKGKAEAFHFYILLALNANTLMNSTYLMIPVN